MADFNAMLDAALLQRPVEGGGLVTVTRNLTTGLQLKVEPASDDDAIAGDSTTKAVTPKAMKAALKAAVAALPGGRLEGAAWVRLPGMYKLLVSGVGTLRLDALNVDGSIALGVLVRAIDEASKPMQYFYAGDAAVAVRATLTGTLEAEII